MTRRDLMVCLIGMTISLQPTATLAVNGVITTKQDQRFLTVWGTHYEMGYAYGYLLAEEIVQNFNLWAVGTGWLHYWTPGEYENEILPYFRSYFAVPSSYQEEAQGVHDGMVASGIDLAVESLGRDLTVEDLHVCNAAPDLHGLTCSSLSGWGESTIEDTVLQGGLIVARDLDFLPGNDCTLGRTSLIVAYQPSDSAELRWISVAFPGIIGALSGMNEHGIGALADMGNCSYTGTIEPNSLIPIAYSIRDCLENWDVDGDGSETLYDVKEAIVDSTSLFAWDIHLISPYVPGGDPPAAILELNNLGDSLRQSADNANFSPEIYSGCVLAVTNHHRVYYPPVTCPRYSLMADSLNADSRLSTQRAQRIEACVASLYTLQSIVFRPNLMDLFTGYANVSHGAHQVTKVHYTWEELFAPATKVEGLDGSVSTPQTFELGQNHPNPFNATTVIPYRIQNQRSAPTTLTVYNIAGQVVRTLINEPQMPGDHRIVWDGRDNDERALASGVYIFRIKTGETMASGKAVLLR